MMQTTEKTAEKVKTGFHFPEEPILVVRPCLQAMCLHIKPAANLLSVFTYHTRKCGEEVEKYTLYRSQTDLVKDTCYEVSDKTLHDIAVPTLQLLGALDMEEHLSCNRYTINLKWLRAGLSQYLSGQERQPQLEKFLIDNLQLEKFLIDREETAIELKTRFPELEEVLIDASQLEKVLINKKIFLLQLEKVLIQNRKISNCQRGRKPTPEAVRNGNFQNTENLEINRDITREKEYGDVASAHRLLTPSFFAGVFEDYRTARQNTDTLPVIDFSHSVAALKALGVQVKSCDVEIHPPTVVGGNTRPFDESWGKHTPPLSGVGDISTSVDESTELNPVIVSTTEARDVVTPSLPYDETPAREIDSQRHSEGVTPTGVARNQQVSDVSYSPGDSTKTETPAPEGEPPKTTRRRGSGTRKPRAKKPEPFVVPEELRERVDKVYAFLDKLRQEVTNDPEERFIHDMDSDKAICELFEGKPPTETRMKKVFLGMWNEARNPRTGYLPRDHMTIPAICKQYKSKAMSLAADENTKALVNTISNQQQYQVVTEDDDMAFTRPSERNRRMRQGA